MEKHSELLTLVDKIKERPEIYFMQGRVEELYAMLLGWDAAKGTNKCRDYISYISNELMIGTNVATYKDVSLHKALNYLVDMEIRSVIE